MVLRLEGAIKKTFVSGEPKYFQMMNLHDWHGTVLWHHDGSICLVLHTFQTYFFTGCLICQFGRYIFHSDVDNFLSSFYNGREWTWLKHFYSCLMTGINSAAWLVLLTIFFEMINFYMLFFSFYVFNRLNA